MADRSLSGGRVTLELYAVSGSWLTWRVSRPLIAMNAERYAREAELDTSIYRIFGEVEVASGARDARPSVAVGFGGAVAGASG